MSTKIDFLVYVKGKLNHQLATLLAAGDLDSARNVQRFLGTQDHIHDGYFSRIAPSFEPITSALMLAVQRLNNAIAAGTTTPSNFNEYALAVLAAVQA